MKCVTRPSPFLVQGNISDFLFLSWFGQGKKLQSLVRRENNFLFSSVCGRLVSFAVYLQRVICNRHFLQHYICIPLPGYSQHGNPTPWKDWVRIWFDFPHRLHFFSIEMTSFEYQQNLPSSKSVKKNISTFFDTLMFRTRSFFQI